ncbi:MAG: PilZ domain-containing protein [Bryobacterales bacterium]|nr:PilZ domain-containing protein [Bryobacterales bacterium]
MTGIVQDQRVEPRYSSSTPATALMRPLDDGSGTAPRPEQTVEVVNLSGSGLRLRSPQAQAAGTLVRVDCQDVMLLGEVCYCEPDGSQFAMGVRLEHSLVHTESLERLRQRFADEEAGWARR